ncbi:MAG: hypothetical protein JW867_07420 [Candidatus Omnitrophica bacterium]|nr:hypothetical protein [Candidatus Omnitrophota bacterium]
MINLNLKAKIYIFSLFTIIGFDSCLRAEGLFDKIELEASASLGYYSNYIWRGFTLDKDAVIQPGVNLSWKGLSFSFWSSFDAESDDELASDEIDYVFDYTKELNDLLSISLGHTYYDFPEIASYSREFYVGFGLSRIPVLDLPIETSLIYYHDYGDESNGGGEGDYVSLDMAYSLLLLEDIGLTMDLGSHYGFNNELFIAGQGSDLAFSFGFTIPLNDNLTVSPTVNYSLPLGDLKDDDDGAQEDRVYGGMALAYNF